MSSLLHDLNLTDPKNKQSQFQRIQLHHDLEVLHQWQWLHLVKLQMVPTIFIHHILD